MDRCCQEQAFSHRFSWILVGESFPVQTVPRFLSQLRYGFGSNCATVVAKNARSGWVKRPKVGDSACIYHKNN